MAVPELCDEPLRLAIRNRHLECARLLLDAGADPNKRYFFGAELSLVSTRDVEFMRLLLTYGARPDTRDRAGLTPLMKAARASDLLKRRIDTKRLLLIHGYDIPDVNGTTDERHDYRTVLHYGVLSGNHSIVTLLIKQGARRVFPPNYRKPTPLDLAILKGIPELVRILVHAGADVNASSPIIGSPLHVACSDSIPQRLPILQMLLHAGADPNIVVDTDGGPPLRPVIAEYLASNEKPCAAVLGLLLRHGAKVIMKTQFRDQLGLLNSLHNLTDHPKLFVALTEAAECFDICMIRRSSQLAELQRQILLACARKPLSLCHQARLAIRHRLGTTNLTMNVKKLQIPTTLMDYLLYEIR
ncbi:hypothetical protein B566_EDAN011863 [Ephemera danica]|nr:hypothetical protein B566_EDAN011863 [Ephemera danica]